jgi:WD40 repeat protein
VLASARLNGFARGIAVSPDGRTALVALADPPGLDLVDLAAGQILRRFGAHPKPVTSAAFSPDGSLAASQGWDLTIRIWSVETGEQVAAFGPSYRHTSHSGGIAFPTRRAVLTKGAFGLYGWHLGSEPGAN